MTPQKIQNDRTRRAQKKTIGVYRGAVYILFHGLPLQLMAAGSLDYNDIKEKFPNDYLLFTGLESFLYIGDGAMAEIRIMFSRSLNYAA